MNSETVFGVATGRYYDAFHGEDPVETYWNLRRKAVLYDVPEKPWQIEGPDAVPFLERVFARRIGNLLEGRGRYTIACTPDGGTFMDGLSNPRPIEVSDSPRCQRSDISAFCFAL